MVNLLDNYQKDFEMKYIDSDDSNPQVRQTPPFDGVELLDGFVNGAIDVFPEDSLFDLCRDNATSINDVVDNLRSYSVPTDNL